MFFPTTRSSFSEQNSHVTSDLPWVLLYWAKSGQYSGILGRYNPISARSSLIESDKIFSPLSRELAANAGPTNIGLFRCSAQAAIRDHDWSSIRGISLQLNEEERMSNAAQWWLIAPFKPRRFLELRIKKVQVNFEIPWSAAWKWYTKTWETNSKIWWYEYGIMFVILFYLFFEISQNPRPITHWSHFGFTRVRLRISKGVWAGKATLPLLLRPRKDFGSI